MKFKIWLPAVLLLTCTSCIKDYEIEGFDSETWKKDFRGCDSLRAQMTDDLEKVKQGLYGKKEYHVIDVLGKPEEESLEERGQKYFYYYLEPGTQCQKRGEFSEANWLQVRINAMSRVSEISFKEQPGRK